MSSMPSFPRFWFAVSRVSCPVDEQCTQKILPFISVPVSSKCETSEFAISLRISGSIGPTCLAHLDTMLMMVPVEMLTPNMLPRRSWMRLLDVSPDVIRETAFHLQCAFIMWA